MTTPALTPLADRLPDLAQPDPTLAQIYDLALAAIADLPEAMQPLAAAVMLEVVDWPEDDMLADLEIDDPLDLTGLYEGVPLPLKQASDPDPFPDRVWLFRRPILAEWHDRGDIPLGLMVAHVTVHEFAHHFGWSDEDIARIDPWWE